MRHVLHILPCLLLIVAGCSNQGPLPSITDIKSMSAVEFNVETGQNIKFDIPQEHWSAVTSALLPATLDRNPAKWQIIGKLEIVTQGGVKQTVWLFHKDEAPGAFAIVEDKDRRVYYRGGDSAKLVDALKVARKAAQGP